MGLESLSFALAGISRSEGNPKENPAMVADTARLFEKARDHIRIVSGGFPFRVYCSERLQNALAQALDRGCTVEVIVGPNAEKECVKHWASRGATVHMLDEWPKKHFAVADGTHARLEGAHDEGDEKREQYVVSRYKNAGKLERDFAELRKRAKGWAEA